MTENEHLFFLEDISDIKALCLGLYCWRPKISPVAPAATTDWFKINNESIIHGDCTMKCWKWIILLKSKECLWIFLLNRIEKIGNHAGSRDNHTDNACKNQGVAQD